MYLIKIKRKLCFPYGSLIQSWYNAEQILNLICYMILVSAKFINSGMKFTHPLQNPCPFMPSSVHLCSLRQLQLYYIWPFPLPISYLIADKLQLQEKEMGIHKRHISDMKIRLIGKRMDVRSCEVRLCAWAMSG